MKNRKRLIIIFTILPLILLFYLYKNQKIELYLSFDRKYNNRILKYTKKITLHFKDPYRIRINNYYFFIYSLEDNLIFQLDSLGNVVKKITKGNDKFKLIINYALDSSNLNILDERSRMFYSINIDSDSIIKAKPIFPFLRGLPLNSENMFFATINNQTHGITFFKYLNLEKIDTLSLPLKRAYDGGFANDGFFVITLQLI